MTKALFIVPNVKRRVLSCVWIRTGNPEQPLTCIWVRGDPRIVVDYQERDTEPYRLCA